ncbi:tetratricopeptide repeat protein [Streptomyces sp. NPDC002589]|uniref:tetratricopeptide repeat protein n=1 Tax=Streptomyces sp. NPDC002589 TaxID=3154420 RepID=UPI00332A74AC
MTDTRVLVQNITAETGFGYGTQYADLHVHGDGTPVYLLEEYVRSAEGPDLASLRKLPSRMLDARNEVVPFTGRDAELTTLRSWRDGATRLAVRLLHGPGGQGKTRLAARFATECRSAGWRVVSARLGVGKPAQSPGSQNLGLDGFRGVLLIVDYADRWDLTALIWLLRNGLLHRKDRPARVLLVARTNAGWRSLRSEMDRAGVHADASDQLLASVAASGGESDDGDGASRVTMYRAARDSFARAYGLSDPNSVPTPCNLDHPDFGLVLTLHVAALVAVDAYVMGAQPPARPDALTRYLLDREQAHWEHLYEQGARGLEYATPVSIMARTAFTAALTGPMPYPDAVAMLERVEKELSSDRVLTDHSYCYPPPMGVGPVPVLSPLYPDRLAEDFLALTLPGHGDTGLTLQPWAPTRLREIVRMPTSAAERGYVARAVTVLAAAAAHWPHVGRGYLNPLLLEEPQLALIGGNAALGLIAEDPTIDSAVLEAVEQKLPRDPHIDFDTGAAAVTQRLVEELRGHPVTEERRAYLSVVLGMRLSSVGRYAEAIEALKPGVEMYRRLADADPARHTLHVAAALEVLAVALNALGRRDQAATAIGEAVELIRCTVVTDTAIGAVQLAHVLHNLSQVLADQGLDESAYDASCEAVELLRPFAAEYPAVERFLAITLDQHGQRLRLLDRYAEALTVAEEANALLVRSVQADTRMYLPEYAKSISNLGALFAFQKDFFNARKNLSVAVDMLREVADGNPDVYRADLAKALMNLGATSVGESTALEAVREAVAIYRDLAAANPDTHLGGLVLSLVQLGSIAAKEKECNAAIDAYNEALSLYHASPDAVPPVHRPILAVLPFRLGEQLHLAGREDEAFAAALRSTVAPDERVLPRLKSDVDRAQLLMQGIGQLVMEERYEDANALLNQAMEVTVPLLDQLPEWPSQRAHMLVLRVRLFSETGDHASVEEASCELLDLRRTLVAADPAEHEPALLHDLAVLVTSLVNQDKYPDALLPTREAYELTRRLAKGVVSLPDLAATVGRFVYVRVRSGEELDDARTAAPEAVRLYQQLADQDPDVHLPRLHTAVNNLAHLLPSTTDDEVLLDGYRTLARFTPEHMADFIVVLNNRCVRLHKAGRTEEALRAVDELIKLDLDQADLASAHNDRAQMLRELGRHAEALVSLDTAVGLSRRFDATLREAQLANIATWLVNSGTLHADLGSPQTALVSLRSAVAIHRRLAEADPGTYLDCLRSSLNDLGTILSEVGRSAEAVATTEEAVTIRRRLAAADSKAPDTHLARSLHNLANQLADAGRLEEALAAAREAVDLRTRLAEQDVRYLPRLASSLYGYARVCAQRGSDLDDGLAAVQKALEILEKLVEEDPETHTRQLYHTRRAYAALLDAVDRGR